MMEPSLPAVKRVWPDSEATAAVTEKRWPFRRREGWDEVDDLDIFWTRNRVR